ncbi:hypothetical protein, partial [Cohaesibacter celericrescens]|uniref:hypothetical protein n=1 Tax=Cohaesibacter celericrescens TaxID=2067669 RepID=UPI003563C79D
QLLGPRVSGITAEQKSEIVGKMDSRAGQQAPFGHNLGFACLCNGLALYTSFAGAADQIVGSSDTNDEPQQKGTTYRTAP